MSQTPRTRAKSSEERVDMDARRYESWCASRNRRTNDPQALHDFIGNVCLNNSPGAAERAYDKVKSYWTDHGYEPLGHQHAENVHRHIASLKLRRSNCLQLIPEETPTARTTATRIVEVQAVRTHLTEPDAAILDVIATASAQDRPIGIAGIMNEVHRINNDHPIAKNPYPHRVVLEAIARIERTARRIGEIGGFLDRLGGENGGYRLRPQG